MFCKKCGQQIPDGADTCPSCGFVLPAPEPTPEPAPAEENVPLQTRAARRAAQGWKSLAQKEARALKAKKLSAWCWCAIVSLCCGCFTFFKGVHRLVRYDSGDSYPYKMVNAYVGGDAYNYIINGTHATAFFVLTAMFALCAIGFMVLHYLSRRGAEHEILQ